MRRLIFLLIAIFLIGSCGGDDTSEPYPDLSVDEDVAGDDTDISIKDTGHYVTDKSHAQVGAVLGNIAADGDTLFLAGTNGFKAALYTIPLSFEEIIEQEQERGKWATFQTVVATDDALFLAGDWQPDDSNMGEGNIFISDSSGGGIQSTLAASGSLTIYAACALGDDFIVGGRLSGAFDGEESNGGADAFVARISPAGEVIWKKQFGGEELDSVQSVALLIGGNIVAVGNSGKGDYLHGFMAIYTPDGEERKFTVLEESRHAWEVTSGQFISYIVGDSVANDEGVVASIIYFLTKTGAISKYTINLVGESSHATGVAVKDEFLYVTGVAIEKEGDPFSAFLLTLSPQGEDHSLLFFEKGSPVNPKVALINHFPVVSTTVRDGEESMIVTTSFSPIEPE